jgi:two-component system sensor histidine kinase KdpD
VFDVEARGAPARIAVLRDVTAVLESEAARDAFVGMLSHELRTPITTIYGTAQVLRRPLGPEARRELIDDLAAETDRLYRLVEDLLVLSRFERGRLDVASEPVLVHRVVEAALARTTAQHRNLRVEVDAPPGLPPALADPTYLEQIIRNLASNAVKYAGEQARVQVRITAEDAGLRIEFEDDGPGIAERDVDRVFALYERLGAHGPVPGAGVGLFVCRRLVEAMGGAISVRRGEGGGACFALTLPTVEDVPAARPGASS